MNKFVIILLSTLFYCSVTLADVATTTTITNTPGETVIDNDTVKTGGATTTVTTETKDSDVPTPEDQRIVTSVYDKFSKTAALIGTHLTAEALNGVVTINGVVTAQAQADAAIEAAQSVGGVVSVRSNVRVTTNPDLNKPSPPVQKY